MSTRELDVVEKIAWVIVCLAVLAVTLARYDGKPNSDIGDFEAWTMLVLSFPGSLVVVALFVGVAAIAQHFYGTVIPTSYSYLTIMWLLWFIIGYLQWFVFLPLAIRWVRRRRSSGPRER